MTKEKVLKFLNECIAVKEQEIALYEKYSVYNQELFILCGYPKREIHIYNSIDKIAKLLNAEIKTEIMDEKNDKKYLKYNSYMFFEIKRKE